jgi:hypothetical protein
MASIAQHQELRAALERYSKEELIDLMEHLLGIYVLKEPVKLDTSVSKPENIKELAGYSFSQVLTWLQNNLELEELDKFRVTPYTVMVSIGDAEFDINGPTPVLASAAHEPEAQETRGRDDDEDLSPAERMDAMELDNKPWRRAPQPAAKKTESHVETPSMADLFANDSRERGFALFDEPPERAEDPDEPPPIADVAPGDDPTVANDSAPATDFAKTAASRDEAPAAPKQETPPPLADGDKQIDPSNRFASLDIDFD